LIPKKHVSYYSTTRLRQNQRSSGSAKVNFSSCCCVHEDEAENYVYDARLMFV